MKNDMSEVELANEELRRFMGNFYRDRFRMASKSLFYLIVLSVLLISVVFYLYVALPKAPKTFYTSNIYNGVVSRLRPLSDPILKPQKLLQRAGNVLSTLLTFNFANYQTVFNSSKQYFTAEGWNQFNNTLQSTGLLDKISAQQLFATATVLEGSKIVNEGVINGYYAWAVDVPVLITYKSSAAVVSSRRQVITAHLVIQRIADLDSTHDAAISGFTVS